MPLQMSSDLRFPQGAPLQLTEGSRDDFVTLALKVASNRKSELETFKRRFCVVMGETHYASSDISWAESDLVRDAHEASEDAPAFLSAFYDACEELEVKGVAVPDESRMNDILIRNQEPFRITNGQLVSSREVPPIEYPEPPAGSAEVVSRALRDAKHLGQGIGASSAIDRVHTAIHAYLTQLCTEAEIDIEDGATASRAFRLLRDRHPRLSVKGHRADEIERILRAFATMIDSLSTLRNKASLAHGNVLLNDAEATACINATNTVFQYIESRISRGPSGELGSR